MLVKIFKKYKTEVGKPVELDLEPTGGVRGMFKSSGITYEIHEYEDRKGKIYLKRAKYVPIQQTQKSEEQWPGYYNTTPNSLTDSIDAVRQGDFNHRNPHTKGFVKWSENQDKIDKCLKEMLKDPILRNGALLRIAYREGVRIGISDTTNPKSFPKNLHAKYLNWRDMNPIEAFAMDQAISNCKTV